MSLRCALSGALVASLAAAGPALGSPQFGRPQQVTRAESLLSPVAAGGPGAALVFAYTPDFPTNGFFRGTWRPGDPLLQPRRTGEGPVTRIRIASSRRGVVALAWEEPYFDDVANQDKAHIRVAVKAPGHPFGRATTVANLGGEPRFDIAVADDRTVAVTWSTAPEGEEPRAEVAVRWPGHAFTPPIRLSRPQHEAAHPSPQLAVSRGGRVLAAWTDNDLTFFGTLRVAQIAGGTLRRVQKISPGENDTDPGFRLVANGDGRVALGWTLFGGGRRTAKLATGSTADGLGRSRSLSRGRGGRGPVPAIGAGGELAAAWFEQASAGRRKLVAAASPGGRRLTHRRELAVGHIVIPRVAVDARGRPSVVWQERRGGRSLVNAATALRGGQFGLQHVLLRTGRRVARTELRSSADRTVALAIEEGAARNGNDRLWSALRDSGLSFHPAEQVAHTRTGDIAFTRPGLVTYGDGGFFAVWHTVSHSNFFDRLRAAVLRP